MKILFISGHYPPNTAGGGEISTHLIARGLVELGHDVSVITDGPQAYENDLDNVRVMSLPLKLSAKPLREKKHSQCVARKLRHAIKSGQYDIVHAHDFRAALALALINDVPKVVTARDYAQLSGCTNNITADGNIDPGCQGIGEAISCQRIAEASPLRKAGRAFQYLFNIKYRRRAFASFPLQVFISDYQKEYVNRYIDAGQQKQAVIYNPVSPDYLSEPIKEGQRGHVLYVGRVEMYKGVRLLLQAWPSVLRNQPQAQLTIVGRGAQREEYERLVQKEAWRDSVKFVDHVPYNQMKSLYDRAQVVVAPHLWVEPFGRTVVEAMARGKVVVAANCGGPGEIIQDGQTGILFERANGRNLTQKLSRALSLDENQRRVMGQAGRGWVKNSLTVDKIARQYQEIYADLD